MDERGDRRTPVSSSVAQYTYLPTGQTSLSHSTGFGPSSSSIPMTMISSAGMTMSRYRAGQNVMCDLASETAVSQIGDAHSSGKTRNRLQNVEDYSSKEDSMHGLTSRDNVGNVYGYANYVNPPGNSFEGLGDRADLFMSQLGLTGRLAPNSLYGGISQESGTHRSVESAAISPLHSTAERSLLSRSVPPYLPLGTESSYVYFNPPSLSSLGAAAELSLSANMHSSLGSFVSPPPSYNPSSTASRLQTCFPTSAASAYNFSVGSGEQENKQTSGTDSASRESYDMPWNLSHVPPEWNTARKSSSKKELDMFGAQYKHAKSTSPKNDSDMQPTIDQPVASNYEGSKKNEKVSPVETEAYTTSQNSSYFPAVHQTSSKRMFQENEAMNSEYREVSPHLSNSRPLPAARSTNQSVGIKGKYAAQSHGSNSQDFTKESMGTVPLYSHASTITSQNMSLQAGSSHSSARQSTSVPFTANVYSGSSESGQSDIGLVSNSAVQKGLITGKNSGSCASNSNNYDPLEEAIRWKKKQTHQSKSVATDCEEALRTSQSPDEKQTHHSVGEMSSRWQTFTSVADEFEEEDEGNIKPPRIKLVLKKNMPFKHTYKTSLPKTSKPSVSGVMKCGKVKGRLDRRTCGICHKTFTRADSLTCHMRVHTGDRLYQCDHCDASYKIAGQLRDHVRSKHTKSRPFVCTKCGKDFSYATARRRHEKVCGVDFAERIEFQCPTCDKGFVTAKGFSKHLLTCFPSDLEYGTERGKDNMPFRCTSCDKSFATFPSLDRHQRFICGRIPQKGIFACEECGKMFQSRNRYITHTRRHAGDKPFKCPQCDMSFYDKGTLKRHRERWHEASGKFKCMLCGKDFYDSRSWRKHMIQQHGSQFIEPMQMMTQQGRRMKLHTCNVCGKSFFWRSLRSHASSEHPSMSLSDIIGKELLKCDICTKEFSSHQILRVHKRGHLSSQRHKCDKCNMQFAVKSVLDFHMRKHFQQSFTPPESEDLTCHMRVNTGHDRPYQCELCGASYKIASHLRDHVRSRHSNSRPFLCAKCGKDFAYSTARRRHEKVCGVDLSERIQFQCSTCDKGFVTAKGFSKHQRTCSYNLGEDAGKAAEMPFKCSACEKSFATFPGLDRHQRFICGRIPQKGIYACEECGKMFYKRDRYITHTRRHAGDKPFKCPQCDLCFYDQGTLKTHMERWHQGSGKYKCALCNKDFFYLRTWKKHMHQHSVGLVNSGNSVPKENLQGRMMKQYTCKVCSKSFVWRGLCAHVAAEHPGMTMSKVLNKDLLKCDICSKEFSCTQSLYVHKRKHTQVKRFKCDRCDLQFAMKSSLIYHSRTHFEGRPHSCDDCGKTFRWSHSLTHHKMTQHASEVENKDKKIERFTCNECGKHFKQENFLYLHLKLKQHGSSQDIPCICSECGRGFGNMSDYKTHMSTHSTVGSKPFRCSLCGLGFDYQYLLDGHMRLAHSSQSFLCHECGKSFTSKFYLQKHVLTHNKYPWKMMPKRAFPKKTAKHRRSDCMKDVATNNMACQTVDENAGMQDGSFAASTSEPKWSRDQSGGLPLPSDALPNFSTFEDQNYQRNFSTFIHQTLAWPKPEGHCVEEG